MLGDVHIGTFHMGKKELFTAWNILLAKIVNPDCFVCRDVIDSAWANQRVVLLWVLFESPEEEEEEEEEQEEEEEKPEEIILWLTELMSC